MIPLTNYSIMNSSTTKNKHWLLVVKQFLHQQVCLNHFYSTKYLFSLRYNQLGTKESAKHLIWITRTFSLSWKQIYQLSQSTPKKRLLAILMELSLLSFLVINQKVTTELFLQEACRFAQMSFWRQKVSTTKNSVRNYLIGSCKSLVYYELETFGIKNRVQHQHKARTLKTTLLKTKSNTSSQ